MEQKVLFNLKYSSVDNCLRPSVGSGTWFLKGVVFRLTLGISGGGVPPWPAASFHLWEYPTVKTSYAPETLEERPPKTGKKKFICKQTVFYKLIF
jgi:hypothetical protein